MQSAKKSTTPFYFVVVGVKVRAFANFAYFKP